MKKKLIETKVSFNLQYDLEDKTIEEVIELFNKLKKKYPDLINWRFKKYGWRHGLDYEELYLVADRYETDKELAARKKKSESAKKSRAKHRAETAMRLTEISRPLAINTRPGLNGGCGAGITDLEVNYEEYYNVYDGSDIGAYCFPGGI